MPSLTIKNIPKDLYERLKQQAEEHRRSLNSEILVVLEQAVGSRLVDPDEILDHVRAIRSSFDLPRLTEATLRKARREGRP